MNRCRFRSTKRLRFIGVIRAAIMPRQIVNGFKTDLTGYEHLDDMCLLHINGRSYEPGLCGSLAADPWSRDPGGGQSLLL